MLSRTNQRINYFKYLKRKPFVNNQYPAYYAYGRKALKSGIQALKIQNKSKILVPEYICEEVILILEELEINILYYPIEDDLKVNWQYLNNTELKNVSAILIIHYFGIAQDIEIAIDFTAKNNLYLLEDNSHGFGGKYKNKLLGTFGDIGFSSPRKSLPVHNGAILYSKNTEIVINPKTTEKIPVLKNIIKNAIGKTIEEVPVFKNLKNKKIKYFQESIINHNFLIDNITYNLIREADHNAISKQRVAIYNLWLNWSVKNNLIPIFKNSVNNYCPLFFPLIFETSSDRNKWMKFLLKENIAVVTWPNLPKCLPNKSSAFILKSKILCLPIHLGMSLKKTQIKINKIRNYN